MELPESLDIDNPEHIGLMLMWVIEHLAVHRLDIESHEITVWWTPKAGAQDDVPPHSHFGWPGDGWSWGLMQVVGVLQEE